MLSLGRKDVQKMKKTKKIAALLLALLLLASLLAGCGSKQCVWCGKTIRGSGHNTDAGYVCDDCYSSLSGVSSAASGSSSNTGVWIAVIVMVFIAVFSATSGVVYLVLQRVLPPEKHHSRVVRTPDYDYDDFEPAVPSNPRPVSTPAPRTTGGMWVCARDGSRNTGPYCTVCGAKRPAAPRPSGETPASQRGPVAGQARPQAPRSQSAPGANHQAPRPRTSYDTEETAGYPRQTPPVQQRQPAAPAFRNPEPVQPQRAPIQSVPTAPASEKPYRPRFARQETPVEEETEYDSEILAAIFREAAKDPEE